MAGQIDFTRDYAEFSSQANDHEKSDDVGVVVSDFLWFNGSVFYPVGALIEAKIAGIWLGEGERPDNDVQNLDLLFQMGGMGAGLFEIVLRSDGLMPVYGGFVYGETVEVTDEIAAGHRVLLTTAGEDRLRFEYDPQHPERPQYAQVFEEGSRTSTVTVRRANKHRRAR